MLSRQKFSHCLCLFFDKLACLLKDDRLDLFDLSVEVDLDSMHLFIKKFLHILIHLRIEISAHNGHATTIT